MNELNRGQTVLLESFPVLNQAFREKVNEGYTYHSFAYVSEAKQEELRITLAKGYERFVLQQKRNRDGFTAATFGREGEVGEEL